jgi:hypothetical protein
VLLIFKVLRILSQCFKSEVIRIAFTALRDYVHRLAALERDAGQPILFGLIGRLISQYRGQLQIRLIYQHRN